MSKRDADLLIDDIIISIEGILEYSSNLEYETFSADQKTLDAVIRNFEIIGEAANQLPPPIREKYPKCKLDSD